MLTARREKKQRVDALRLVPLFAGCTSDELAGIDRLGVRIDVPTGRVLTREDRPGLECFVVLAGSAIVHRAGQPIAVVDCGSIVGEVALLNDSVRNATVVAGTPMQLLVLDGRELTELRRIAPRIGARLERMAAHRRAGSG